LEKKKLLKVPFRDLKGVLSVISCDPLAKMAIGNGKLAVVNWQW